ncbi:protein FAM200C-like [Palaemon carinicauda]|uniref:protein FAM200C-like n=1 Tax=Palaemon carinicauda TaxID=392227 RepID=UPI0035B662D9
MYNYSSHSNPFIIKLILFGEESQRKLSKISLSDNTVKRRIDELSEDIKEQVLDKIKASRFFAIQCDENVSMENSLWTLVQNLFNIDVELLLESLQEEAVDLKCDSSVKRDFETIKLEEFWVKYLPMYPKVGEEALRVILPFSSTYLCEAGFSALVVLKTKQRNRLDVENDLRCALSSFNTRISH